MVEWNRSARHIVVIIMLMFAVCDAVMIATAAGFILDPIFMSEPDSTESVLRVLASIVIFTVIAVTAGVCLWVGDEQERINKDKTLRIRIRNIRRHGGHGYGK